MEIELGSFQEAILKVIEVEEHAIHIKLSLRIAVGEVESTGTTELDIRQLTDRPAQQFLLLQRITTACLTTAPHGIKQRYRPEVSLQVSQLVVAGSQHLGYGQLTTVEMLRQI